MPCSHKHEISGRRRNNLLMSIMWKTSNIGQTCLQEHKNLFTIPSRKSDEKEKEKEKKTTTKMAMAKLFALNANAMVSGIFASVL